MIGLDGLAAQIATLQSDVSTVGAALIGVAVVALLFAWTKGFVFSNT